MALACNRCNAHKGPNLSAYDPITEELVPLFNPRTDSWDDHFCFRDLHVIGLTPVGRATVALLNMNEADRVQLRTELAEDEPRSENRS